MTQQIQAGLHRTDAVANGSRGPSPGPGRKKAQDVGTEHFGQLEGSSAYGSPRDEEDTLAGTNLRTVSVIVATRQRSHLLKPLVDAVLSDPGTLELIIVVDGMDDHHSVDLLDKLREDDDRLIYFCTDKSGQSRALQTGVLAARGDLVLLLDDDVLPQSPLSTGHARRHGHHDNLVVVGAMPVAGPNPLGVASRIYSSAYEGHCRAILETNAPVLDSLWMGNVSLCRAHCLAVGIYSPYFTSTYHNDRDFGYRLDEAGLVGVFDPSLRAVHLHSRTSEAFLRDAVRQGSGLKSLYDVHAERLGPFSPRLLTGNLPYPIYLMLLGISITPMAPRISRLFMRAGSKAARLHLGELEIALSKAAQHVMQWRGARVGEHV